jgi:hypothetical protein
MNAAKSIFSSKTFWINALALAVTIGGFLPPAYGLPALAILNIANRFLTTSPATLLGGQ